MSIDTCGDPETNSPLSPSDSLLSPRQRWQTDFNQQSAIKVFGPAAKGGSVYRWGWAVARSGPCDPTTVAMTTLATDGKLSKPKRHPIDLARSAESFVEWLRTTAEPTAAESCSAIVWAAALPALLTKLETGVIDSLCDALVDFRESILQRATASSVSHLMVGAELGLTLAWRCNGFPQARTWESSSRNALAAWVAEDHDSVSAALEQPLEVRMVLGSLIRCKRLMRKATKTKWVKGADGLADQLATWVCAMTVPTGATAFSDTTRKQVKDDLGESGLLSAACQFDPECLTPALDAALGTAPDSGRLVWQVSLPEAFHHDERAKLAVMFPDWDVRRGRTHIDYSSDDVRLEIMAGRTPVLAGRWQTTIESDGAQQTSEGEWTEICQFSDDDVHYLELEQRWTDGLLLQRQFMLIRDDRCLMLADSIIPQPDRKDLPGAIKYTCRIPIANGIEFCGEPETHEGFLADQKPLAMVIPLSASEWVIGPTAATARHSNDGCLVHSASGSGRLYAPLWFDFQKRRFKRKRTWRQLTVVDQLRLVGRDEAVSFRVQVGSEQWAVYRSLGQRVCRSFLGKHLIADFFSSRFDPEDGGHEALITVDDDDTVQDE